MFLFFLYLINKNPFYSGTHQFLQLCLLRRLSLSAGREAADKNVLFPSEDKARLKCRLLLWRALTDIKAGPKKEDVAESRPDADIKDTRIGKS